jgi:hypothetical protein
MKLRRIGQIFDPFKYNLGRLSVGYAQSPQVLVLPDLVRIYFSTRTRDSSGKFLSHVASADFDKNLQAVLSVSTHEIIPLGELGCFDEHGIFPFHVFRHRERIFAYTCGWSRRVSVSVETGIGLAESFDGGHTFVRHGSGPVLTSSAHEPFLVGDGFVIHHGGCYRMWYIFGTDWKTKGGDIAERTYKIGQATSEDGVHWIKSGGRQVIRDLLGDDECQALPTIVRIGATFHMFFCFRESFDFRECSDRGYRLGHASSPDLLHWDRTMTDMVFLGPAENWDNGMQCYPHAFVLDGRAYLLYNGNDFGKLGFGIAEIIVD